MIRVPFRIGLFLSSYSPLFFLLAWTNRHCAAASWTLVAIAAASLLALLAVLLAFRANKGQILVVRDAVPDDGEVLAYVATYLVPFFGVDLAVSDDRVVFVTFLVVLGIVYVNSNMILVNPVLSLAGFHAFRVTDADGYQYNVFTRRREVDPGLNLRPAQVDRYLRIEVRRD